MRPSEYILNPERLETLLVFSLITVISLLMFLAWAVSSTKRKLAIVYKR